ncbi:MAG: dihydroorotate dehydrogenase, partial [Actinomycetota bacterium]
MRTRRADAALDRLGAVEVGGVRLRTPFMTASGTSGHDTELSFAMDLSRLGAVTVKSLWHGPWAGNPAPRVHTAAAGMLNAVGLQGPGTDAWIDESLPRLEALGASCVASIWGRTVEEYALAARSLVRAGTRVLAVEVNLSCPNLEGRSGIIAHDPVVSAGAVSAVVAVSPVPVWAKLSPNTDRIIEVAESVIGAGARALTLVNTVLGMGVDPVSGRALLGNGGGGLSGRAIHPVAVRAVHDVHVALPGVDIVGVGGISTGADALEMFRVGATAVQVGTASFARPDATLRIAREAALLAER